MTLQLRLDPAHPLYDPVRTAVRQKEPPYWWRGPLKREEMITATVTFGEHTAEYALVGIDEAVGSPTYDFITTWQPLYNGSLIGPRRGA
ncbi:hypothetical protein SEA_PHRAPPUCCINO_163 [Mycobacterium phage Phrappuccino]|uniref:Uncharacterized protein n=1 Tax=Mycobacterium phage Phrappuccino TaxID=2591223 RepID=A0A514DE15_9CAUD|nr:hypothetical protein KHQ87_gp163 [Mycobacterium phage Phrappuccino]QDH91838.1 hypothetical protein SEA_PHRAPPUCCINO_163 [Mycobacterium phage Phrappuccino]QIQ63280.1 hypothetical protein SEA_SETTECANDELA_163 [Mycobacterium phage Settecandela]